METMKELGKGLSWASSMETLLATVEEALDQLKSVANSANKTKQPITDYDVYVKRVEEEAAITDKGWLEAGRRAGLFQPSRGIALVLFVDGSINP